MKGKRILVAGKVQGVGFRPYVWQIAHTLNVVGQVFNHSQGVTIELTSEESVPFFIKALWQNLPPLARIDDIQVEDHEWDFLPESFDIIESSSDTMTTHIAPDAATCSSCVSELLDPTSRRWQYPFLNCTHCGPRFSIIRAMPYDRAMTAMGKFPLCLACQKEYDNPADRRFHAQPVACGDCGPQLQLVDKKGMLLSDKHGSMIKAVSLLLDGKILAVKGIGGFHLVCDARSEQAVALLRARKNRMSKPFAIMMPSMAMARQYTVINEKEHVLLDSIAAPIVLLKKCLESTDLAENIAPNLDRLGIMLPSNPLQHALLVQISAPLIMTSGNSNGLPPVLSNSEALEQLADLADAFILHDRDIVQRLDDSIVKIRTDGSIEMLRRARGYVPDVLPLPEGFSGADGALALGGDLKACFALGYQNSAIMSQYLGDLSTLENQSAYQKTLRHFLALFDRKPSAVYRDAHSGYQSRHCFTDDNARYVDIYHHHAHVASCLGEHGYPLSSKPILAWALDGIGMGQDGTAWGGELLLADYHSCERIGGMPTVAWIGGDKAAKEPWRMWFAHLAQFAPELLDNAILSSDLAHKPIAIMEKALENKIQCPQVRSMGRWFDAVAASLGVCFDRISYEGEAAIQLMTLAERYSTQEETISLRIHWLDNHEFDLFSFWKDWSLLTGTIEYKAWSFHKALAIALAEKFLEMSDVYQVQDLILTGGVFHNDLLVYLIQAALPDSVRCLISSQLSCGDEGLAFGQLLIGLAHDQDNHKEG